MIIYKIDAFWTEDDRAELQRLCEENNEIQNYYSPTIRVCFSEFILIITYIILSLKYLEPTFPQYSLTNTNNTHR